MSINAAPAKFWSSTSYCQKDIQGLFNDFGERSQFLYLEMAEDKSFKVSPSKKAVTGEGAHLKTVLLFFKEVFEFWEGELPPVGSGVVIWLDDGLFWYRQDASVRIPVLAYARSRSDFNTFLIPDPAYMGARAYEQELTELDSREIPWEQKSDLLFWRGAASGRLVGTDRWAEASRVKVCELSTKYEWLDAKLTRIPYEAGSPEAIRLQPYVGDFVPFNEFVNYKYQLDIDGFSCAWISCFKKLYMNSVLFKLLEEYEQWYYDQLSPWTNYIPVTGSFIELREKYRWASEHPGECMEINKAATNLVKGLTYESQLSETRKTVAQVFSFYR